jgi:hypothetical protein
MWIKRVLLLSLVLCIIWTATIMMFNPEFIRDVPSYIRCGGGASLIIIEFCGIEGVLNLFDD